MSESSGFNSDFGPCEAWELDESCCTFPESATPEMITRWQGVSTQLLWAASGRIYGPCPVTVRPCLKSCIGGPGGAYFPYLGRDGLWRNAVTCGCGADCACDELCEIILEGPVTEVTLVTIGTEEVFDWRLDRIGDQARLVRTSDLCWPECQDMQSAEGEAGTFAVTYLRGLPLDDAAIAAHSELTCELVKSCIPNCECRLPRNVQSKTRQGITVTFDTSQTWIRALPMVAAWLDTVNPQKLPHPMRVISPDSRPARRA